MKNIDYIKTYLKNNLTDKRYYHSLGTAQTAQKLAVLFELDKEKAYLAGLIHDCAKNMENETLLKIIKEEIKTGFIEEELKNPKTFHAIVGSYLAQKEFDIDDVEILNAIKKHTIGDIDMTIFDKIIFLADKIEPNARDEKYSDKLWKLIKKNKGETGLNLALLRCFSETIKSLIKRKLYICPTTINVYNLLIEEVGDLLEEE